MLRFSTNFEQLKLKKFDFIKDFKNLPLFEYLRTQPKFNFYDFYLDKFKNFSNIIHLGTGGSSLGPQAILQALGNSNKKFDFFDNIDPIVFSEKFKNIDFKSTGVIVASKSGDTAETLVQLATVLNFFSEQSISISNHFIFICQKCDNALYQFAMKNNIDVIEHNPNIGGRFAVFSEVGIFPGILAGFDMLGFCKGANDIYGSFMDDSQNHPAMRAGVYLAESKLHPVNFIYSNQLRLYGSWFAQLWAESLGKTNANGERFGTTPFIALGAVDQHSQVQLYLDGPRDKFFTFLSCKEYENLPVADLKIDHQAYKYLAGKNLNKLYKAELRATYQTMLNNNLPARIIEVDEINAYNLGQLMMLSVLETLIVANLWGVNPFDQPAVEEGKKLAVDFLSELR